MFTNGMQGILAIITYPIIFVFVITVEYLVFVRNDEILIVLIENNSFHNKICIEPIETIEGHYSSGFKVTFVSSNARKSVVVDLNVEVLVNLLLKMGLPSDLLIVLLVYTMILIILTM
jgi:uncharacterized membrane protein YesL